MFADSNIVAALIAGVVTLLVAGASGIYAVVQSRKRNDFIRKELLAKADVEAL
ncbi:hypothetical protein [Pseudomonas sp. GM78]|uniref:hypothetical protein n=1 Tax=Pseudomonas sp. GM78 TaxID=1144337 RepID=UPI0012F94ABC|nr:hypothetical protein [Pseudomonas sp. GM78]